MQEKFKIVSSFIILQLLILFVVPFPISIYAQRVNKILTPREIAKISLPSTVLLEIYNEKTRLVSSGSGFFVTENVVATNFHVVEGMSTGTAKIVGQKNIYDIISIVGTDKGNDLALVRLKDIKARPLKLNKDNSIAIGDEVYAIGNPRGLEGTFSQGIVSGIRKSISDNLLQITASVSKGSSGGPIINSKGEVVGIAVSAIQSGQLLNFAVPVNHLQDLINNSLGVRAKGNSFIKSLTIPKNAGFIAENSNGLEVAEQNSDILINPASVVKIATAYAVLKVFGPVYRFPTNVWTDGQVDQATGTLSGNLYVTGRDPIFNYEHAVSIANELNRAGIRTITGDLVITGDFIMNFNGSAQRAGNNLFATLDATKRSATATRAWETYLINSAKIHQISSVPSVSFGGSLYVQSLPNSAKLIFSHESAPLRAIIKATLCYSNNFVSERLGDMLGGHHAVTKIVHLNANVAPEEFILASSSGLGINRVTPRAMMNLLRAFRADLARQNMNLADVMPVAGVDEGILKNYFNFKNSRSSIIGTSGRLQNSKAVDNVFLGEVLTGSGGFLVMIFSPQGNGYGKFQNDFIFSFQDQFGGAKFLNYNSLDKRNLLLTNRFLHPKIKN